MQRLTPTHTNDTFPLDMRSHCTQLNLSIQAFSLKVTLYLVYSQDFIRYKALSLYRLYEQCTRYLSNVDYNHAFDIHIQLYLAEFM